MLRALFAPVAFGYYWVLLTPALTRGIQAVFRGWKLSTAHTLPATRNVEAASTLTVSAFRVRNLLDTETINSPGVDPLL